MELIDKAELVSEIKKLKGQLLRDTGSFLISMQTISKDEAYNAVLSCIDNLEVKESKEVNWTEEIIKAHEENGWQYPDNFALLEDVARHFYKLGLKTRKEA